MILFYQKDSIVFHPLLAAGGGFVSYFSQENDISDYFRIAHKSRTQNYHHRQNQKSYIRIENDINNNNISFIYFSSFNMRNINS